MKFIFPVLITILLAIQPAYSQTLIEGIPFPDEFNTGSSSLKLNGGGVREKYFMDMYVVALYLSKPSSDAAAIINAEQPMSVRLHIVSSLITSEKMIEAVEQGFARSTKGKSVPLRPKIDQFIDTYREKINKGDVFDLVYIPGKGTAILKNGKLKATIEGHDFKAGLFGIWLGDDPADEDLKKELLGKD